jgi:CheY-like chemotaxis protein
VALGSILVIEDDIDVRNSVVGVLVDEGYDVVEAQHGAAALEILKDMSELPRLILLDLWMPVLDGWGFREQQLLDPRIARVPVIVMSASLPQTQPRGIRGFLKKPVSLSELLDAVAVR